MKAKQNKMLLATTMQSSRTRDKNIIIIRNKCAKAVNGNNAHCMHNMATGMSTHTQYECVCVCVHVCCWQHCDII